MKSDKQAPNIVNQDIALDSYLNKLLEEIPADVALEEPDAASVNENNLSFKTESELISKAKSGKKKRLQQEQVIQTPPDLIHPMAVMPEWTQHEFQALFFKIDQLVLAVPLTELLRTIKIEKPPTAIPNQPSWFMGLLDEHEHRIGVLDTGQLILGKTKGKLRDLTTQPFKSILITHDGKWGLACDEILSIGTLKPEKVRWRTSRQKRAWLVGTIIEELIAIIDVNQLVPSRKAG